MRGMRGGYGSDINMGVIWIPKEGHTYEGGIWRRDIEEGYGRDMI